VYETPGRKAYRVGMSGTNFIMMVIMILILLFVLMNIGPLVAF
jgi:hypothetical protein